MPIITKISAQQRNKKKANIYIDGKYTFSLSVQEIITNKLVSNQQINQDELNSLITKSELEHIIAKILNFISYRPRSEKEVTDRLKRYTKEYESTSLLNLALDRIRSLNLIDDQSFASWFISQRIDHKPRSMKEICYELHRKGVPKEIVSNALESSQYNEEKALSKIILKKTKSTKLSKKNHQKLTQYLLKRGFQYSIIKKLLPSTNNASTAYS